MSILPSMYPPTIDVDLSPERIAEEKVGDSLFFCDLFDTEVVHKLAQMLLPGLATACVDNTSGDLFKTPGSVAVDLRKEMIEYVTQRSESFVAESVILEGGPDGEPSDHPFDIISNFVDDFANSKSNLFTRVSGWLLSEKREDRIDDFVQEMEMNNFWTLDRRGSIAETFLKNIDFENKFHCGMKFNSLDELANHVSCCNFRPMLCENEGCNSRFTAGHLEKHDSTCPFKIIPCEQRCSDSIMRRHMDRHCITVCPMKIVNCPFYAVGCRSAIAQCLLEKHHSDDVRSHLWHLLKGKYKGASGEDLQRRVEQIVQASSVSRLAEAHDVRSLNVIVKDIEAKLGPFELRAVKQDGAETVTTNDGKGSDNNAKGSEPSAKAVAENDDREDSGTNKKGSEPSTENFDKNDGEDIDNNKKGSEPSTKALDMVNSSEKAKASDIINMDSSKITAGEKDGQRSRIGSQDSEESTEIPNMHSLSNKAEIGIVNMDSAHIYRENNDGAAGEFKSNGNEVSTQTNVKILSDREISATSKDRAEDSFKNKHVDDSIFEDKDNEHSIQNSKMQTKGSAEYNIKNKEVEDDDFRESLQADEV